MCSCVQIAQESPETVSSTRGLKTKERKPREGKNNGGDKSLSLSNRNCLHHNWTEIRNIFTFRRWAMLYYFGPMDIFHLKSVEYSRTIHTRAIYSPLEHNDICLSCEQTQELKYYRLLQISAIHRERNTICSFRSKTQNDLNHTGICRQFRYISILLL